LAIYSSLFENEFRDQLLKRRSGMLFNDPCGSGGICMRRYHRLRKVTIIEGLMRGVPEHSPSILAHINHVVK
jgi:hypothetical protein